MKKVYEKFVVQDSALQQKLIDAIDKLSEKGRRKVSPKSLIRNAEKAIYYLEVWVHTEEVEHLIKDNNLRGNQYQLDHIIPISYGYYNKIDPKIIGSLFNLQVIPTIDNWSKNNNITPQAQELLDKLDYECRDDILLRPYKKVFKRQ